MEGTGIVTATSFHVLLRRYFTTAGGALADRYETRGKVEEHELERLFLRRQRVRGAFRRNDTTFHLRALRAGVIGWNPGALRGSKEIDWRAQVLLGVVADGLSPER